MTNYQPLPGQTFTGGVSNFIFGSNMSQDWANNTSRNNAQIQAQLKAAGLTVMRCQIPAGSSDVYIKQTVQACQAMNVAMLVILNHADLTWNTHLVQQLGTACSMYEFSNEPDLEGITWQQYLAGWNQHIPALKATLAGLSTPHTAAFIGPVLGVFANIDSYFVPWLQGCKASGVLPDAVSYHIYPCTGSYTAATCLPRATAFQSAAQKVEASVVGIIGKSLPQCLTEWNLDAANPPASFARDGSYVPGWTKTAIDSMVAAGLAMACQWDAAGGAGSGFDDLVNTQTLQPNGNGQLQAIAERVSHYMSGTPTPVPTPTPTPTPGVNTKPLTLSYSNAVSMVKSSGNVLLITEAGTPPSAQSYTTFGTGLGLVEITASSSTQIPQTSMLTIPTGKGFYLDPASLNLAGQTLVPGEWSHIIRLNAAKTITNPQSGTLVGDIHVIVSKYNIHTQMYTMIVNFALYKQTFTPSFTNYPMSATLDNPVDFVDGDTIYIEQWVNVTQNNNNDAHQGFRFNRLATGQVGDPFGTLTTAGYIPTPEPIPTPPPTEPTVTLTGTGITPGTYDGAITVALATPVTVAVKVVIQS